MDIKYLIFSLLLISPFGKLISQNNSENHNSSKQKIFSQYYISQCDGVDSNGIVIPNKRDGKVSGLREVICIKKLEIAELDKENAEGEKRIAEGEKRIAKQEQILKLLDSTKEKKD